MPSMQHMQLDRRVRAAAVLRCPLGWTELTDGRSALPVGFFAQLAGHKGLHDQVRSTEDICRNLQRQTDFSWHLRRLC